MELSAMADAPERIRARASDSAATVERLDEYRVITNVIDLKIIRMKFIDTLYGVCPEPCSAHRLDFVGIARGNFSNQGRESAE